MRTSLPHSFRFASLPIVLILFCCLSIALAQQTRDVPVTSTVSDYIDDPLAGRIYMQIQSDGGGSYRTVATKGGYSVVSTIQGIGDWELDTGLYVKNLTRQVFIDLTHPVPNSGANAPFATALVRPRFLSQASRYGNSMFSFTNGETKAAPLIFGFDYNNVQYRIHMTPDSGSIYPYPETDYVNITCTGADANNQCDRWQIKPNGTKGGCLTLDCSVKQNVVKLVKLVTTRNTTTEVDLGDFYMTFSIGITKP